MRILNKHSHWWKKEEKEWAWQDRHGNWWLSKSEDENSMKSPNKKRQVQRSDRFSTETYLAIFGASALGVIVAAIIAMLIS